MLNDDIRELLEAVSLSDQRRAKDKAIAICQKELEKGSANNKRLCDFVIRNIKNRPQWMEIPARAKDLLIYEDLEQTFDDRLYYFAAEEQELELRILTMTDTCKKLNSVGIRYRNATLLLGPSGCGKSVFARHIAKRLGRSFYMVDLSSIVDSALGGSAKNLKNIFDSIMDIGPNGFLFLDELDGFTQTRDFGCKGNVNGSVDRELGRISIALMQLLDKLPPDTIIMAATNHEETIDPAVLRRFSIRHTVKPFSIEDKVKMVEKYLTAIKENAEGVFSISWDPEHLRSFVSAFGDASNDRLIIRTQQAIAEMLLKDESVLTLFHEWERETL